MVLALAYYQERSGGYDPLATEKVVFKFAN